MRQRRPVLDDEDSLTADLVGVGELKQVFSGGESPDPTIGR